MASHERKSQLFSSELSSNYDSFVEENLSTSPNGPFYGSNFGSSYSSPIGSEMGSPETESEDEVTLAELTRRMAEFTFEDDEDNYVNGQSQNSAPGSFFHEYSEASGLYGGYNSSSSGYDFNQGFMSASKQSAADSVVAQNPDSSDIFNLQDFGMRNQPQVKKQGVECGGRRAKAAEQKEHRRSNPHKIQDRKTWRSSGHGRSGSTSSNLPLPGGGPGMRAVFLGGSSTRSVCNGTGVFLPSGIYSKAEPKRKPGCSTVLIPARVLQTLQQHFIHGSAKSQSQNTGGSTNQQWQNDVLGRPKGLLSQEQAVFQIHPLATDYDQEEFQLPQEWTY